MLQPALATLPQTLSKSDFKTGRSCLQKLVYKKRRYPTTDASADFMKLLIEGGFIVGKLAQLLYPGVLITGSIAEALAETSALLQANHTITLHEAAIQWGQMIVRIDILEKTGDRLRVIEAKAKSFNSDDDRDKERKSLREYEDDVLFQVMVLQGAMPAAKVDACLLLADKTTRTQIEGLASWFKMVTEHDDQQQPQCRAAFVYETHPNREQFIELLRKDSLLCLGEPLAAQFAERLPAIKAAAEKMIAVLNNGIRCNDGDVVISKACNGCEYRGNPQNRLDGYTECWGDLAVVSPHVFDLYRGGAVGGRPPLINDLISRRRVSLYDFAETDFQNKKGELGAHGQRQLIQYRNTKTGAEWRSDHLHSSLCDLQFPLHFIDFETYTGAIPFHKGMHPYDPVIFQWSCHTVYERGAAPVHSEWLNTEPTFPNFRFAEALMAQIGDSGTPLMWATHENTMLKKILEQMDTRGYNNPALWAWLMRMTKDSRTGREGRLIDMNAMTLEHYFHPEMKGRTSIKKTLPAIWKNQPYLHDVPWFRPYFMQDAGGIVSDPYEALKHLSGDAESDASAESVTEGGAAMKAYWELMWGDPARKECLKNQLLEYCKLDTMAMVIVWTHWCKIADSNHTPVNRY